MHTVLLDECDVTQLNSLVASIAARYGSTEDQDFLSDSTVYAHELPRELRAQINAFRLHETDGVMIIRGFQVDDTRIGPTPCHWKDRPKASPTLAADICFSSAHRSSAILSAGPRSKRGG